MNNPSLANLTIVLALAARIPFHNVKGPEHPRAIRVNCISFCKDINFEKTKYHLTSLESTPCKSLKDDFYIKTSMLCFCVEYS